jgi:cytochrome oxidase Cu insertion factor (SCO1/SenC/PrrC family)
MTKPLVFGALILPLLAIGAYAGLRKPAPAALAPAPAATAGPVSEFRAGLFDPPRAAPAFSLDGSNGAKVGLRDQLGKVVILEFGFTYCEHVCPITLARLTEVHRKLGAASQDVQLIFITVDPKRDSPGRLREHLAEFNPNFLGATGSLASTRCGKPTALSPSKSPPRTRHSNTRSTIRRSSTSSIARASFARWCPSALPPTTSFTTWSFC